MSLSFAVPRRWPALLLALVLFAVPAAAQETTGSIGGVVKDQEGAILPGATVTATGPMGNIVTTTDGKGEFRFPRLASGKYKVSAVLDGFAVSETDLDLTVGQTLGVDFSLKLAGIEESVQVSASATAVDLTSSSTATNISRERIELIPRGRDFSDLVGQAAGAGDESQAGGISIDGSSGAENRFVIDGIDTTSPQVGTSAVPLRAEFLEEVQVKTAGYAAEFGGSTGGVINVITKSGSNTWRGGLLFQFEDSSLAGDARPILVDSLTSNTFEYITPEKDDESRTDPGVYLSGPIFRDHMWFFASYQPGLRSTERTVKFSNGTVNAFPQDFRVDYGTGNVTGNIGSKLLYRAGANFSPYETEGTLPLQSGRTSLTALADYTRGFKGERNSFSGSIDYIPTNRLTFSARVGRFLTDGESTGVKFPSLIHNFSTASTPAGLAALPDQYRRVSGFSSDVLVTDAQAMDQYKRTYLGVDGTVYFSAAGEHQLKAGYQTEFIFNDVQKGYNADRILYYAGRSYLTSTGQVVQGTYGYFRLLNISTLGQTDSRNDALFIQDNWKVNNRLTLNLGLRAEHERVPNFGERGAKNPIEFKFGDKLAPRLGFTYDVFGDQKWKAYGSWGRYFDVMKYELPRGSFGGEKWVDYFYAWNSPNWESNASGCATGTNSISERPTCAAGTFIEALDRRFNAAEALDEAVDPNLKPMLQNELQLGLSHELTNRIVLGARYIRKDLARTIEDVGVLVPGIGEVFYIANPGEGISLELADPGVPNFPKAEREYQGLELTFDRRFSNNWALHLSYTISRLYGNYSGLASSDEDGRTAPNVNRFFDHIENTFDRNGELVYGRLGTDRPHQFKGQFIYRFAWGTTMGLNQRVMSGIPISEEANVTASSIPFFPYGRNNLDRTDVFTQTDLNFGHGMRVGKLDLQLGLTVLNVFDQDAVTRRYNNRTFGSLPLTTSQFFAGGWDYERLITPTIADVKFNQPDAFQNPRAVRFDVKIGF